VTHEFLIQAAAADVYLDDNRVVWRLDPPKQLKSSKT
jgi:hypothetical protein